MIRKQNNVPKETINLIQKDTNNPTITIVKRGFLGDIQRLQKAQKEDIIQSIKIGDKDTQKVIFEDYILTIFEDKWFRDATKLTYIKIGFEGHSVINIGQKVYKIFKQEREEEGIKACPIIPCDIYFKSYFRVQQELAEVGTQDMKESTKYLIANSKAYRVMKNLELGIELIKLGYRVNPVERFKQLTIETKIEWYDLVVIIESYGKLIEEDKIEKIREVYKQSISFEELQERYRERDSIFNQEELFNLCDFYIKRYEDRV